MSKPIKLITTEKLPILKKRPKEKLPKDILEWEAEHIKFNDSGIPISQHTCYLGGYKLQPLGISDIDYSRVGRALTKF
jgi:hypothetical protein